MLDFIKAGIVLFFLIIAILLGTYMTINGLDFIFDKSNCTIYVNQEQVYAGRSHYINISSIGENGNTKHLTIYKDIFNLKPLKHYINNDIEVREW